MVIIPGIFGEAEVRYFTDDTFEAFEKLINNNIAHMLARYIKNPEADLNVVLMLQRHYDNLLNSILSNDKLINKDIRLIAFTSNTSNIENMSDVTKVSNTLEKIDTIVNNSVSTIAPRTKEAFDNFAQEYAIVIQRMIADGAQFTYDQPLVYFKANSACLYKKGERVQNLASNRFRKNKDNWYSAQQGIKWKHYVEEHNITGGMQL